MWCNAITCTPQRPWCAQDAFELEAKLDAARILMQLVEEGTVLLTGAVRSLAEPIEAQRTAWSVPGVRRVENLISVVESHRRSRAAWRRGPVSTVCCGNRAELDISDAIPLTGQRFD